MFDVTGKRVLVTGSSQGMGKEIAKALADQGAVVYVHGSKASEKLTQAAAYVGTDRIVTADLLAPDAAQKLYAQTGDVDILILNASVQIKKSWDAFTPEEFDMHMNANVKSSYFIIRQYIAGMKEKHWGRIITVGSVNQYNNHPQLMVYGVTKAAQMKMVENIAPSIAPFGITINNIAPGAIETPRNETALSDPAFREKVVASIPAGYLGNAKELNGAVLLLSSDEGRYITGSEIVVDGGMKL